MAAAENAAAFNWQTRRCNGRYAAELHRDGRDRWLRTDRLEVVPTSFLPIFDPGIEIYARTEILAELVIC